MRRQHILLFFCLSIISFSCYEDYDLSNETLIEQEEDIFYDGELVGKAVDEFGIPMNDAQIDYAGNNKRVSNKGFFHFEAERVLHQGELLTLQTNTGFRYLHTTFPSRDDINYSLASFYSARDIQRTSATDFQVQLSNQVVLTQQASSFLLENNPYSGEIIVEGYYLHLGKDDNHMFFPNALTHNPEVVYLDKIEGIHFQWSSTDGRPISLASDKVIDVQLPTNSSVSDVHVYYFNKNTALWEKQMKPDLQNGNYSFIISSDGYYCIASALRAAHIDGRVLSQGKAVPNTTIEILDRDQKLINRTYTSATGAWHSVVPTENLHVVRVMGTCDDVLASVEIDAKNYPAREVTITIDDLPVFVGASKSCDNQLIANSIFLVDSDYFIWSPDGELNTALPICPQAMTSLSAYDLQGEQESASLDWNAQPNNNIQSLFICDVPKNNYIALRADGVMRYYEITNTNIGADQRINIIATDVSDPEFTFELRIPFQSPGDVETDELNIAFNDRNLGNNGYATSCFSLDADCGFQSFQLNHIGEKDNEWICGSFTAKFWMRTTNLSPNLAYNNRSIEGEFRVKRNF